MAETQIIPAVDLHGLENALAELQQEGIILPELKKQADALIISGPEEYTNGGVLLAKVRSIKKLGKFKIGPFQEVAKRVTDFLRGELTKHEAQAEAAEQIISNKMESYRTEEKRKADEETRREQEKLRVETERKAAEERKVAEAQAEADRKKRQAEIEAAKASGELKAREAAKLQKQADADALAAIEAAAKQEVLTAAAVPVVKVEASIPKVAGSKNQTYYRFEIIAPQEVKAAWLIPDAVAIGRKVRDDKDPEKSMAEIGGVKAWSEG